MFILFEATLMAVSKAQWSINRHNYEHLIVINIIDSIN